MFAASCHCTCRQVLLQEDPQPTTTTAAAAAAHDMQGSKSTTTDPVERLNKLLSVKKLQLAGFQQELRSKLVSEAPHKQYCHVSLPGAPAGGVWTVAGTDTAAAAASGGSSKVTIRRTGGRTERLWMLCNTQELCSRKHKVRRVACGWEVLGDKCVVADLQGSHLLYCVVCSLSVLVQIDTTGRSLGSHST